MIFLAAVCSLISAVGHHYHTLPPLTVRVRSHVGLLRRCYSQLHSLSNPQSLSSLQALPLSMPPFFPLHFIYFSPAAASISSCLHQDQTPAEGLISFRPLSLSILLVQHSRVLMGLKIEDTWVMGFAV